MGMLYLWQSFGLGPHGDAGFIMIPICMVAEWAVAGFLFGIGQSVYLHNKGRRRSSEVTHKGRSRKPLLYALLIIALGVGGYLLQQEARIAMDRKYFLEKVNYKEFADTCLEMVVNPDKYGLSLGNCKADDPKLPEAIRRIKASTLSYHGYEVRISNFYFQGLAFSHNMKDATRYNVVFESNYREPVPLYSLHSTNLPKIDWH